MKRLICTIVIAYLTTTAAFAQATPAGLWKTFDGAGAPLTLVRILGPDEEGQYKGKIEKVLAGAEVYRPTCWKCQGYEQDRPVLGMTVLFQLTKGDEDSRYVDGILLDPRTGIKRKCQVNLINGGRTMKVRTSPVTVDTWSVLINLRSPHET